MTQHSITRVELHGATTNAQYDGLHKVMAQHNYIRTIRDVNNVAHRLPTATYYAAINDGVTVDQIRDQVVTIVSGYWALPRSFEAICTLGPSAWHNLP